MKRLITVIMIMSQYSDCDLARVKAWISPSQLGRVLGRPSNVTTMLLRPIGGAA
jgi:hypothetical protein